MLSEDAVYIRINGRFHAVCGLFTGPHVDTHTDAGERRVKMGDILGNFKGKLGCQSKWCIFLMGRVKPGLCEL